MAKTKAADPKKRIKKIVASIRSSEDQAAIVDELRALLDGSPTTLAEVNAQRVLPRAAEADMLDVCELLLERGADPKARVEDDWIPGIASMAAASGDDGRVIALLRRMVALGADPNERGNDETVLDRVIGHSLARVEGVLALGLTQDTLLAGLRPALSVRDPERAASTAALLLARIEDVDRPGADGLSALHQVALGGSAALLRAALTRSAAPAHPVAALSGYNCDGCSPPGGGLIPQLWLPRGFTALDVVIEVHAVYAAAVDWYGDEGFDAKGRRARRDALAENAALLAERGVPHGAPIRDPMPAFAPEIDALLGRLAAHVGGDAAALQRRAAAVPAEEVGPWTYTSTLLERSAGLLLRGAVEARRGDSWLVHVISGDHRRFVTARNKELGGRSPDLSVYPSPGQRALKTGLVVGGRGDAALVVWPKAPGVACVGVAKPDSFEVLGDDFNGFLRAELAGLGVAIDDIAESGARGPSRRGTKVLKADYETPPGPDQISRVGGLPIGVDATAWPRRDGAPMVHVLTVDLEQHPFYQPDGVRALALFISSPRDHEAYQPRNDYTRVVLLSEADLKKGEPAWPEGLDRSEALQAGTLRYEDAPTLTAEELYKHSYLGFLPQWLQGDDAGEFGEFGPDDEYDGDEDEYDGDEDGEDDEDDEGDVRPGAPQNFVMQFDEGLIPGINLGDAGIMYVYAETAWFQCH